MLKVLESTAPTAEAAVYERYAAASQAREESLCCPVSYAGNYLQAIPQDLYEAARIDGASKWQQFWHITLPQLGPVLLVVGVITISGYFQLFAEPYVMTRGDPLQSTVSVLYFMFEEGFKWWNLGRASAVAFMLFLIILAVTTVLLRIGRRRELV